MHRTSSSPRLPAAQTVATNADSTPDAPSATPAVPDVNSHLLPNGPKGMLFEDMNLRELGRRFAR